MIRQGAAREPARLETKCNCGQRISLFQNPQNIKQNKKTNKNLHKYGKLERVSSVHV